MNELDALQASFLRAISQAEPTPDEAPRLAIYRNAYFSRLLGVLREDYPALRHWLGDVAFEHLSQQYCNEFPSSHFSLRQFGEKLPDYVANHPTYSGRPELAELAEWERQLRFLFDCEDATPIRIEHLQQFAPEQWGLLQFERVPACLQVTHRHATVTYWKAFKEGAPAEQGADATSTYRWLLWRKEFVTHFRSLGDDEFAALDCVGQGHSFSDLCDVLWDWHEDNAPLMAARYLQGWLQEGLLGKVSTAD